jgi:hypothetical protein
LPNTYDRLSTNLELGSSVHIVILSLYVKIASLITSSLYLIKNKLVIEISY